jgi:hypothetical protein
LSARNYVIHMARKTDTVLFYNQLLGPDALRDVDVTEYAYDNVTGVGPLTTTSDNIREYGTTRQRVNGVVPNHDSLLKELRDGNPYR